MALNVEQSIMNGIDALIPMEIARKAEAIGAKKVRLDRLSLVTLAILAAAYRARGNVCIPAADAHGPTFGHTGD